MTHRRPPPSARRSVRFRAAASPAHRAPPAGNRQTAPWPEAQPPIRRGNRHPTGRPPPGRVRSSRPAQSPLRRSASLRRGPSPIVRLFWSASRPGGPPRSTNRSAVPSPVPHEHGCRPRSLFSGSRLAVAAAWQMQPQTQMRENGLLHICSYARP